MSGLSIRAQGEALLFDVAARPNAPRSAVQGLLGSALKVAVQAPPDKGKANKELISFLAGWLGVKRSQLEITRGQASREKTVRVEGVSAEELFRRVEQL